MNRERRIHLSALAPPRGSASAQNGISRHYFRVKFDTNITDALFTILAAMIGLGVSTMCRVKNVNKQKCFEEHKVHGLNEINYIFP